MICRTKLPLRRSYRSSFFGGLRTGSPQCTNGLELNPTFCFPSSRFSRTIQLPSACRSFCFEMSSSGAILFRAEPVDSMQPSANTRRAFAVCNPHLASAPNLVQRALGKCFGSDSVLVFESQSTPGLRNAFNALSRCSQKNEETPGISMHRVDLHGRRCRLFTNDSRIPKLTFLSGKELLARQSRRLQPIIYKGNRSQVKPNRSRANHSWLGTQPRSFWRSFAHLAFALFCARLRFSSGVSFDQNSRDTAPSVFRNISACLAFTILLSGDCSRSRSRRNASNPRLNAS